MFKKMKLDIFENNRITDTIENVTSTDPDNLVISLEAFRQTVNDKLTQKVIANDGNFENNIEDEWSSSEDESTEVNCGSPKKKKK